MVESYPTNDPVTMDTSGIVFKDSSVKVPITAPNYIRSFATTVTSEITVAEQSTLLDFAVHESFADEALA